MIPYIFFVALIGFTGVIAEMSFGPCYPDLVRSTHLAAPARQAANENSEKPLA